MVHPELLSILSSAEAFRKWMRQISSDRVEGALLALRQYLMDSAPEDTDLYERYVRENIIPEIRAAGVSEPLLIAFDLVQARLSQNGDELFRHLVARAEAINLHVLAAKACAEWADWCLARGDAERAETLLKHAQNQLRSLCRMEEADQLYVGRAKLLFRLTDWDKAVPRLEQWLEEVSTPQAKACLRLELAHCLLRAGDPVSADSQLSMAAVAFIDIQDVFNEYVTIVHRANWFWQLGAHDRAETQLRKAVQWFRERGHVIQADVAEANIAAICVASGRCLEWAVETLGEAGERCGKRDPLLWWQLQMNLAAAHEKLGQCTDAANVYRRLADAEYVRRWESKLAAINFIHLRLSSGELDGLDRDIRAMASDPVVCDDDNLHFFSLQNLGDWHRLLGQEDQAARSYSLALDYLEKKRSGLPWEFLRWQLRRSRDTVVDQLEASLLRQRQWRLAWQVIDRAGAQSFQDFLCGQYPHIEEEDRCKFVQSRRNLGQAYRAAEGRLTDSQAAASHGHDDATIDRLECLVDQVLADSRRRYVPEKQDHTWDACDRLYATDTALLQFRRSDRGLDAYVVRNGSVSHYPLMSSSDTVALESDIGRWWRYYYESGMSRLDRTQWDVKTQEWHRALLDPVSSDIEGVNRLMVVPATALCLLPWSGLYDEHRAVCFGDRFKQGLTVIPGGRVGAILAARSPAPSGGTSLVARPSSNLPFTDWEASWIADRIGGRLLADEEMSWDAMQYLLQQCRWFHYCGHGQYRQDRPMASHLHLAAGERWTAWDMVMTPMPSTTVVLAACEVGSMYGTQEGEWFGLLRGFLAAGSQAVLAALWETPDWSTVSLMRSFYRYVFEGKRDVATALSEAQRRVRQVADLAGILLARRDAILDTPAWERALDMDGGLLAITSEQGLTYEFLDILKSGMSCWRRTTAGQYANNAQCWEALWKLVSELACFGHPRYWSAFQVYGVAGRPNCDDNIEENANEQKSGIHPGGDRGGDTEQHSTARPGSDSC